MFFQIISMPSPRQSRSYKLDPLLFPPFRSEGSYQEEGKAPMVLSFPFTCFPPGGPKCGPEGSRAVGIGNRYVMANCEGLFRSLNNLHCHREEVRWGEECSRSRTWPVDDYIELGRVRKLRHKGLIPRSFLPLLPENSLKRYGSPTPRPEALEPRLLLGSSRVPTTEVSRL